MATGPAPPLVAYAVVTLAGVLWVQWLPSLWPVSVSLPLALLALAVSGGLRGYRRLILVWVASSCWAASVGQRAMQARWPRAWEGRDVVAIGRIYELPHAQPGATMFLFQLRLDQSQGEWQGRARISWYHPPLLQPCQQWRLRLRLRRPRAPINPGVSDGERAALEHEVAAVGYVRAAAVAQRLGQSWCIDRVRTAFSARIQQALPQRHATGLLRAFAVGDVRGLSQQDWAIARANGIPHLIAISGFHVGMAGVVGGWWVWCVYALYPRLGLRWPRPLVTRHEICQGATDNLSVNTGGPSPA